MSGAKSHVTGKLEDFISGGVISGYFTRVYVSRVCVCLDPDDADVEHEQTAGQERQVPEHQDEPAGHLLVDLLHLRHRGHGRLLRLGLHPRISLLLLPLLALSSHTPLLLTQVGTKPPNPRPRTPQSPRTPLLALPSHTPLLLTQVGTKPPNPPSQNPQSARTPRVPEPPRVPQPSRVPQPPPPPRSLLTHTTPCNGKR